jgi:hypothetical protein
MLKKDANKGDINSKQARQDLTEKCRITTHIKTPEMMKTISQLLSADSRVKKQLDEALGRMYWLVI